MLHCEHRDDNCPKLAAKWMLMYFREIGSLNEEYYCEDHALERLLYLEYDDLVNVWALDDHNTGGWSGFDPSVSCTPSRVCLTLVFDRFIYSGHNLGG